MNKISRQKRTWRSTLLGSLLLFFLPQVSAQTLTDRMEAAGLVDIHTEVPSIVVELMYGGEENFVGKVLYPPGELSSAYLLPHFVRKLARAQEILKREKGKCYSLIIYDAARPLSVQKRMFEAVRGTPYTAYVSSGKNGGGRHTYGAAVDLSIVDTCTGEPLDMGSPVDFFGEEAHLSATPELIGREAYRNRQYLISLMARVGLRPIRKEWWHFQEPEGIGEVKRKYKMLDF